MYESTKNYIKGRIIELIEQCNDEKRAKGKVTIDDIQTIVNEIKLTTLNPIEKLIFGYKTTNKNIIYKRVDLTKEDMILKISEYGEAINNLHTHTSVED